MDIESWKALLRSRIPGHHLEPDVLDEIVEHVDELYREQIALGRSHDRSLAAIDEELRDMGALARAARAARHRRSAPAPEPPPGAAAGLASFGRDLAYAARLLAARPSFTAVAVLTLALGIGANTAIFSIVHSMLLAPLPFHDPDRLVMMWEQDAANPESIYIVAAPNWQDWERESTSFEHLALWENLRFNLSGEAEPAQVLGMRASSGLFPMLGVQPRLGRTFTKAEEAPGHHVVVISDALWRGHFGARPDIIGHRTRVNGKPHEVIGVMPPSFVFEQRRHQLWVPIALTEPDAQRGGHSFRAAARLKGGVSFEAAQAEIDAIARRIAARHPDTNRNETATITRLAELGVVQMKPTLYALCGAVALVLLIACVNVANLLLAQAAGRQREFAIRTALGAGRGRLASQLLAEGLLLSLAGGVLGVAIAWAGTAALQQTLPPSIRFVPLREVSGSPLDAAVLAFTCGVAVLTGILFSLAPIVSIIRTKPNESLKASGDRGGTGRFTALRGTLVAVEVALAVVVLAGAGLMLKSVSRLMAVDPGLNPRNVLAMMLALPQTDFYGPAERTTFCEDVSRQVATVPGVASVGAISHLPLSGANASRALTVEGRPVTRPEERASAAYRVTCPGYFGTLGIAIIAGRDFTHSDATAAPHVVIVNEATAQAYWPGRDPVGQRIKIGDAEAPTPWLTVVGVVRNVRHFGLDAQAAREMFRPYPQAAWPIMTITVRSAADTAAVAGPVRSALQRIDPDQPVTAIRTMDEVIADSTGQRRFPMMLLGLFSVVALALAAIGVYGVVAYIVSQRTREIGIRMALGARARQVVGLVLGRSLIPIAGGMVAGVAGSIAASRLLETLLYGVTPHDPGVLAAIVVLLGVSAVTACVLPARRAAMVDPLVVLKEN